MVLGWAVTDYFPKLITDYFRPGTGSTVTGLSGWMLQSSTVASGNATYQVKVLGLTRGPDNAIGNYARWNIFINLPALQPGTAGL